MTPPATLFDDHDAAGAAPAPGQAAATPRAGSGGPRVVVFTDGACTGNPGPGGWAWAEDDGGAWASGVESPSTNQRMEITAALMAVMAHPDQPIEVVSDSTYVVNCFRDRWYEGWLRKGWKNSKKEPVANRDLWEPFIALVLERAGDPGRTVTFRWVKGHSMDPMNDLVDRLAVEAARTQAPASGDAPPEVLPEPDRPRPYRSRR